MSFDYTYWMRLPNELRQHILNFLSQTDAESFAAVSPQLNDDVNALYNNEIYTEGLTVDTCSSVLKQRISKLILNHSTTSHLAGPFTPANSSTTFLKYPKLIRYLNIETENIHHTLYKALMEETCKYVVHLNVHFNSDDEGSYMSSCPQIRFKNLKRLELIHSQATNITMDSPFNLPVRALNNLNETNDMFLNIMRNIEPSSPLDYLSVEFEFETVAQHYLAVFYTTAIFSLIIQNPSLKVVEYNYRNTCVHHLHSIILQYLSFDDQILKYLDFPPKVLLDFRRFHIPPTRPQDTAFKPGTTLDTIRVNLAGLPNGPLLVMLDSWKSLIKGQNNLKCLSFEVERCNVIEDSFLETFISNVESTITIVSIYWSPATDNVEKMPLNLEIFGKCNDLRELQLIEWTLNPREAINFFRLPKSLRCLDIRFIKLSTLEINQYFRYKTDLQILIFSGVRGDGTDANKGVHPSSLDYILDQPELLRVEIGEINVPTEDEKRWMREIFQEFNIDDNVFKLERNLPGQRFKRISRH